MSTPSIGPHWPFLWYENQIQPLKEAEADSLQDDELFSMLCKAPFETLHLDIKDEYKIEQAFIFWTGVSFVGTKFKPYQEGEDKTEFVERVRNWCKSNRNECLNIKTLSITNSSLESIPVDIKYFENLEELRAFGNKLNDISHVAKLKKLEILQLQHNEIEEVPEDLFNEMIALKKVFIYCNKIKNLKNLLHSISKRSFEIAISSQKLIEVTTKDEDDWVLLFNGN